MNIFEITVQYRSENGFPVVVEQTQSGNLPVRREGYLKFSENDLDALKDELSHLELDPKGYGTKLGKALFHETVRDLFMQARSASQGDLRVLLVVEDPGLKPLHWERLCGPIRLDGNWDFLARDQQILFSMYLPSQTDRRFPAIGRQDIRALVLIADPPEGNDYSLAPFDAAGTSAGIQASMGDIPHDILSNLQGSAGPPTIDTLCSRITGGHYTLLHITAHGWFNTETGETILYLLDKDGGVAPVSTSQLLERLDRLQGARGLPHLAFLSTCDSCAPEAESAGAFGGLAQRMVRELGMPAVIAMTQKVSMDTADRLSAAFYKRLRDHGEVDRALVQSCADIADAADLTVPALFSRLGGRPLFSDTQERPLTGTEIEHGLSRLEDLIPERAPVMTDGFQKQFRVLKKYAGIDESTVSDAARQERHNALDAVNNISEEILDLNFRAVALDHQIPGYDARCPFPGLYAFQEKDREFFFGREPLINRLFDRFEDRRFLAVLGPSGSGKSSIVLAGLTPEIQKQDPEIQVCYMTPGSDPAARLEKSVGAVKDADHGRRLLVVDQFEELFTLCPDIEKRKQFIARLMDLHRNGLEIILTMRADFWGDCANDTELRTMMQDHQQLIPAMNTTELRSAMEQQAAAVGLRFEADLSHTILSEVRNEPGAMPLLQHLLQELWKRRHGRWLRAAEYRALGGIRQGIAHTADEIYRRFSDNEKEQMRNIFVRLTRLGDQGQAGQEFRDTRRRVSLKNLIPAGQQAQIIRNIVNRLADARLVITRSVDNETEVEVTHEALIRHWPRLRKWLDEDRHSLRLLADISEDARTWDENGRQDNLLPRWNARLEEAVILFRQPRFTQNELERDYLQACTDLRDRETAQQAAYMAGLRKRLAAAVIGIIIATIAGGFAFFQKQEAVLQKQEAVEQKQIADVQKQKAEKQTRIADEKLIEARHNLGFVYNEKTEDALASFNFNAARLYALHALAGFEPKRAKTEKAKACGILVSYPDYPIIFSVPDASHHRGAIKSVDFSPDGKTLASGSANRTVRLWDTVTGKEKTTLLGHTGDVRCVRFSPDGKTLATGSADKTIRLWDTSTGKEKLILSGHNSSIETIDFSPDGKTLVTSDMIISISMVYLDPENNTSDQTIYFWDTETGKIRDKISDQMGWISDMNFSPDGKTLALAAGREIRLWDAATAKETARLSGHTASVNSVRFSPTGKTIASGASDKTVRLWDLTTKMEKVTLSGHTSSITSLTFSSDGKMLASAARDKTVRLWDLAAGKEKAIFTGHTGTVNSVTFSPAAKIIASGADDHTIRIWDAAAEKETSHFYGQTEAVMAVVFSPDGRMFATGGAEHIIRLWDTAEGKEKTRLSVHPHWVRSLTFSPDGKILASGLSNGTIRLRDMETGKEKPGFSGHKQGITGLSFSPDGKTLASGADKIIRLWDMESGKEKKTLMGHTGLIMSVRFSPDGKMIASGAWDRTVRLWDAETGKEQATLSGHTNDVWSVTFSPDGKILASSSADRTIRLWDVAEKKEMGMMTGHTADILWVCFSPDGKTIASGSADRTIRLWDVAEKKEKVQLAGHTNSVSCVTFSPDGRILASTSVDNTVRLWDVAPEKTKKIHSADVWSVRYSPDGNTLASGASDKIICLWDTVTGKQKATLLGHLNYVSIVRYSPDGKSIASGSLDATIRIWDVMTGKEKGRYKTDVWDLSFSPDGKTLAAGSSDRSIHLLDAQTGKKRSQISGHTGDVMSVGYSPNGKSLASGSYDKTIRIYDTATEKEKLVLYGHMAKIKCLSYSPDGKTLASGSDDNTIRLWDAGTGKIKTILIGHTDPVKSVCFSPDGKTLASSSGGYGSSDHTIRLWDTETGKEKATLTGHTNSVWCVTFSPDGNNLASGSKDHTIRFWDLSLFYQFKDRQVNEANIEKIRKAYNLKPVNLELKPIDSERNLYGAEYHPPKWPETHPFHWLPGAESGDADAMVALGIIYDRANESEKAAYWYEKAINAGNRQAMVRMQLLRHF